MIHLSEGRLASVKRERDLVTPAWQRLYDVCYQYQSVAEPYGEGHMTGFALAGLLANRPDWKNKAVALALSRCEMGYEAISYQRTGYGHHGGVREVVPAVACVYDWLYTWMSDAQRAEVEKWIINWGELCWPETQPEDRRALYGRNDPGDNFYAGFMYASMAAGLVLTTRAAERPLEGGSMLNAARRRWMAELIPHKAQFEPDGFPLEGSSYGVQALTNLLLCVDAWQSVKGENLWLNAPRLINQYLLHMTTPDMKRLTLWGDNAIWPGGKGVNLMPLNDYATYPAWIAQNLVPGTGSPTSFAWWLKNINPMPPGGWTIALQDRPGNWEAEYPAHLRLPAGVRNHEGYVPDLPESVFGPFRPPSPFHWLAWVPVLFARPELREVPTVARPPIVSPGNGFAIALQISSDSHMLTPRAESTQLSFICGPSIQAHQDRAQGAIQIYKDGEMLIGSARLWNSYWADWRSAENHSTLLLPPNHQVEPVWNDPDIPPGWKAAAAGVQIMRSVSADRYLYLEGELAGAYAHRGPWHDDPEKRWVNPLKRWTRRILWHRAHDLFLFIDEVETQPWAQQPVIAWQVRDKPVVRGGTWIVQVDDKRLFGLNVTQQLVPRVTVTEVGSSYRVEVSPLVNGRPFPQTLQITRGTEDPRVVSLYDQQGAIGATFHSLTSASDSVTLAVQVGDTPDVTKRLYYTQRDDQGQRVFESKEEFLSQVAQETGNMIQSSRLLVTSHREAFAPKPDGEFILIKKS